MLRQVRRIEPFVVRVDVPVPVKAGQLFTSGPRSFDTGDHADSHDQEDEGGRRSQGGPGDMELSPLPPREVGSHAEQSLGRRRRSRRPPEHPQGTAVGPGMEVGRQRLRPQER